ncbi:MAG: nucleotide exchange factor GrpE [Chloroflexi bacterium]|nr:nucleotide exchange factor GrpE [Chloroflexota bacterium]
MKLFNTKKEVEIEVSSEPNQDQVEEVVDQKSNSILVDPTAEDLQLQLVEEQRKSAEYLESCQRLRADFLNLKRRTENERASLSTEARERLLVRILPIVDDFERALQSLPEGLKSEPWINGINLIEKKLKNLLDQEGVSELPAKEAEFDPRFHEAVQHDEDTSGKQDYVAEVYQKGYRMGDKVIRPAMVKVARR